MTGLILSLTNYLIIYLLYMIPHYIVIVWRRRSAYWYGEPTNGKQGLETNQGTAALHYGIAWNGYGWKFFWALPYDILRFSSWDMVGGKFEKHLGIFLVS